MMSELTFVYFDLAHAVEIHDWIIEHTGGKPGNNDLRYLESPLGHIQNDLYYPNIEDKLAHLVFSVIKNHAFSDGNKRSSVALGAYFLELNGYDYCVQNFVQQMENICVWVAGNVIDKNLLNKIIASLIYEEDFNESLKLELAMVLISIEGNEEDD